MSEKMSDMGVTHALARAEHGDERDRVAACKALATHISALQREADGLREALAVHEKRTAFMRKISPHVAAMLDEYDAPVAAVLSEGCGSPQDRSSEEKQ